MDFGDCRYRKVNLEMRVSDGELIFNRIPTFSELDSGNWIVENLTFGKALILAYHRVPIRHTTCGKGVFWGRTWRFPVLVFTHNSRGHSE